MLAVARALVARPKLLMLDEPSLGLAPLVTQELFRVVHQLNEQEGLTVLVVEQNAQIALDSLAPRLRPRGRPGRRRGRERGAARARGRPQVVPGLLMLTLAFTWSEFFQQVVFGLAIGARLREPRARASS